MAEFGGTWRAGACGTGISLENAPGPELELVFGGAPAAPIEAMTLPPRCARDAGREQVVLAGYLTTAADFPVLDSVSLPVMEPFGLLESLPAEVVAEAER